MMISAPKTKEKLCCVFFERCSPRLPRGTAYCVLRPHRVLLSIGPRCPLADVRRLLRPCSLAMAVAMLHHAYRRSALAMRIHLPLKDTHGHCSTLWIVCVHASPSACYSTHLCLLPIPVLVPYDYYKKINWRLAYLFTVMGKIWWRP